jgi:hypothetical protein
MTFVIYAPLGESTLRLDLGKGGCRYAESENNSNKSSLEHHHIDRKSSSWNGAGFLGMKGIK